jgi:hypothetical protein
MLIVSIGVHVCMKSTNEHKGGAMFIGFRFVSEKPSICGIALLFFAREHGNTDTPLHVEKE